MEQHQVNAIAPVACTSETSAGKLKTNRFLQTQMVNEAPWLSGIPRSLPTHVRIGIASNADI